MMFKLITERTFLFIFLFSILYFSVFSKISKEKIEDFVKEKDKIEKSLNQQKLSNYLTKLMMKNDNIIDNEMYFLDNEDFKFGNEDINYSSMQMQDNDNEFKARIFALKWAQSNEKQKGLKPYHVKDGEEKLDNWKSFLVLMMGQEEEYVLKKVCFPDRQGENFGIVTEFSHNCKDKVDLIYLIR